MSDRVFPKLGSTDTTKVRAPPSGAVVSGQVAAETQLRQNANSSIAPTEAQGSANQANATVHESGAPGRVLGGRYLLQRKLGTGGMGVVYLASDQQVEGETFAIKVLRPQIREHPDALELVREEVRKTRLLAHPNVVGVYSVNIDQRDVFILMEYLEGKPLSALLDEDFARGMPFGRAWPLIQDMCAGLAHAHDHGVVHSDLKPSNVFVTISGRAKLLDFGIARASRGRVGHFDPATLGALTPAYASCEMLEGGDPDERDDVYSLACVIYEMLSGKRPFSSASAIEARRGGQSLAPIRSLTPGQNAALARALSFDRAQRTPTVETLLAEFGRVAASRLHWLNPGRHPVVSLALLTAVALLISITTWRSVRTSAHVEPTRSVALQEPAGGRRLISTAKALALFRLLGIDAPPTAGRVELDAAAVLELLSTAPRHVVLGSSPEQIDAALALCRQYATDCQREWFTDEAARSVVLAPYALDRTSVSVGDFRIFVANSNYRTDAELAGVAYRAIDGRLSPVKNGSWRNAVGQSTPDPEAAVVGVDYKDAEAYCRSRGKRLPTEDEREYAARGPEGHVFPWGDDATPAILHFNSQPRVTEGPPQGIGGAFRGLSGAVWEWVDTEVGGRKVLKGGSWLETNPANKRAATRGYELANRANGSTGFRCVRSSAQWPDAQFWLSQLVGS